MHRHGTMTEMEFKIYPRNLGHENQFIIMNEELVKPI
jgi:hypothetical protein